MRFLIDFAYLLLCVLGLPYLLYKLVTAERFRAGLVQRLGGVVAREGDGPAIWIHAVSVGEVLAARPLIQAMAAELPGWDICISTITNTGQAVARKNFPEHLVFYYPLDVSFVIERVLRRIRPSLIVLVELEIWPNFLDAARRHAIPTILVNGRITEKSYRGYQKIRWLLMPSLSKLRKFCVQTEDYADRFRRLGIGSAQIAVTGTMKYDTPQVEAPEALRAAVRETLHLKPSEPVLIGGSTHSSEERYILDAWEEARRQHPGLRLILVPRHPERVPEVTRLLEERKLPFLLRTQLEFEADATDRILVVDTVGELGRFWSVGTVVFVGGSLVPHGGQNMLEPAGHGRAILVGPHTRNFRAEVRELLARDAIIQVADPEELTRALCQLLDQPERIQALGERASKMVEEGRGSTRKHLAVIQGLAAEVEESRASG